MFWLVAVVRAAGHSGQFHRFSLREGPIKTSYNLRAALGRGGARQGREGVCRVFSFGLIHGVYVVARGGFDRLGVTGVTPGFGAHGALLRT